MMAVLSDKKEMQHIISVLEQSQKALEQSDSFRLHELSDQTIHSASIFQDVDSITIAVLIYSLNKIVTKKNTISQKEWKNFVKRYNEEIDKAKESLRARDAPECARHLHHAKEVLETHLGKRMAAYVKDILRKASINKATKVYEHGISLEQTAHLLGLTQWELADYVGQRVMHDVQYTATIDEKKRAKKALAFFS